MAWYRPPGDVLDPFVKVAAHAGANARRNVSTVVLATSRRNPVSLFAGKSGAVIYTNLDTEESVSFQSRGTRLQQTTDETTGTQTFEYSGHVGLVLFPTDVPAGPSTTQISGRLVFTVDSTGVGEVQTVEGNQIDICASLA